MGYFVVINEQGPAWVPSRPMREQEKWAEHAAFVNGLLDDGFVVLGGPIPGAPIHRARLIVRSSSEEAVRARLADDPWMRMGLLQNVSIEGWDVLVSKDD
jgi:uncharacterized protein YciI